MMDYVEKKQVVHALSRRRRPGACAVQAFCPKGKILMPAEFSSAEQIESELGFPHGLPCGA